MQEPAQNQKTKPSVEKKMVIDPKPNNLSSQELERTLVPPASLSTEKRWIVRLKGNDMGPFSFAEVYPLLLKGEVEPETLLLEQASFERFRLRDLTEWQPFLALHNTCNPILLEEKRQQEKDELWRKKGKKRLIALVVVVILLLLGVASYWYFVLSKAGDQYIADGDYKFGVSAPFQTIKDRKERDWSKWKPRFVGKKGKKGNQTTSDVGKTIDFSAGSGDNIPYAKLQSIGSRNIRTVFSCFKAQYERDRSFDGGVLRFNIQGKTGTIIKVGMEKGDAGRILLACIRQKTQSWSFPTFQGNAVILLPLWISKR